MNPKHEVPLLTLSCREASRLISESLDRDLTRRERWSLRIHRALCSACRRFTRQVEAIRATVANMPEAVRQQWLASESLSADKRQQIKRLLSDAQRSESLD